MTLPLFVYRHLTTPLGDMLVANGPDGLLGAWFSGQRHHPAAALVSTWHLGNHPAIDLAEQALASYWAGQKPTKPLTLDMGQGTAFQRSVWQALMRIPLGHTRTYGELARELGQPLAVRAVGAAVGRNPWSVLVPCHRVLGAKGALTGYAGGLERKEALLALEERTHHAALAHS